MMRFMASTCGIFVEAVAFDSAGPPLAIGCAVIGLTVAAIAWWTDFNQLIDRIIGLDLQGPDVPYTDTETG